MVEFFFVLCKDVFSGPFDGEVEGLGYVEKEVVAFETKMCF